METAIKAIQDSPVPSVMMVAGLLFIVSGFNGKIKEILEVLPKKKKASILIGLLFLTIGLVLCFSPSSNSSGTISNSPWPMILMLQGAMFLLSGFDSKQQKKLTVSIGLLSLTIGLVLYLSPYFSPSANRAGTALTSELTPIPKLTPIAFNKSGASSISESTPRSD